MEEFHLQHPIRVIGIGGAGTNAVNRMVQVGVAGVDFIAANTDLQALRQSESRNLMHLGQRVTRGLGAGANPDVGARAANESQELIEEACAGAELLFIAAGMGGGTGSGAAPKVAQIARNAGTIVVGVVTMPFAFEGRRRHTIAEESLQALQAEVDTIVVVHNDRLLKILDPQHARMDIAFRVADECLRHAVEGIVGLIDKPGIINLDFADVKSVLREGGMGHFSIGYGRGEAAPQEAMRRALSSPLLGRDGIDGARSVIVNFRGSNEMSLHSVTEAMGPIAKIVAPDAPIFFGTGIDTSLGERVEVTVMAVGLEEVQAKAAAPRVPSAQTTAPQPVERERPIRRSPLRRAPAEQKIVPLPQTEYEQVQSSPSTSFTERADDPYPMDDLSIPAFLRRRKRVSA